MKASETKAKVDSKYPRAQTKSSITKFFDVIDRIDRSLYGYRMRLFILSIFLVLIIAPLIDDLLKDREDRATHYADILFLILILLLILSFVSSWRDDSGNWSWQQTKSRLLVHWQLFKESLIKIWRNSRHENLYRFAQFLIFGAIAWKALQNVSVFLRKPIERLISQRILFLRHFESDAKHYYWIPLVLGILIIYLLARKNAKIWGRIKMDFGQFFNIRRKGFGQYSKQDIRIATQSVLELVINSKDKQHVASIISVSKSQLFNDFIIATQEWNTNYARSEYEYQIRFYNHLKAKLPRAVIEREYPIGQGSKGYRGRADIVVNRTILIEMKRDDSSGAIDRASGQILKYSNMWVGKGPVILLLCDYEYQHAKQSYTSTMNILANQKKSALTILALPKIRY